MWFGFFIACCLGLLAYIIYSVKNEWKSVNPVITKQPLNTIEIQNSAQVPTDHIVETIKNVNKEKGDDFEKFIIEKFPKPYFNLKNWRSDKIHKGIHPESNCYPDLEYEFMHNGIKDSIAIECKYRKRFVDDNLSIASDEQLLRYRSFQAENKMDVYITLGVGGIPNDPEELYLIPLQAISFGTITKDFVKPFRRNNINFFYDLPKRKLK
jgi:hypothetical protein